MRSYKISNSCLLFSSFLLLSHNVGKSGIEDSICMEKGKIEVVVYIKLADKCMNWTCVDFFAQEKKDKKVASLYNRKPLVLHTLL